MPYQERAGKALEMREIGGKNRAAEGGWWAACSLHPSELGIMIPLRNSMCELGILYAIRKIVQTLLLMCRRNKSNVNSSLSFQVPKMGFLLFHLSSSLSTLRYFVSKIQLRALEYPFTLIRAVGTRISLIFWLNHSVFGRIRAICN